MEEKKNKNKGLIVAIVILILLVLGLGGYIVYDKVLKEEPKQIEQPKEEAIEQQEVLIPENTFKLDNITCENDETNSCVKKVKLAYNNENHEVKLIKKLIDKDKYSIEVYIDNVIVETLNGGQFYDWGENKVATDWINNLDGYIYVIDEKYLGLVYRYEGAKPSWFLKFYNDTKPFGSENDILVASYGGSLAVDGKTLTDLDALEFDGTSIKYWSQYCGNEIKPKSSNGEEIYVVAQQHSLTFDGNNISNVVNKTVKNAIGGGQSLC